MENNKNHQFITSLILEDICQWINSLTDSRSPTLVHVTPVFRQAQRWGGGNKTVKAKNWTRFSLQFGGIMINSKRENIIIKLKLSLTNCFCQTWILIFAPEGYIWKPFWIPIVYNTVSFLKYKIHIQWGRKTTKSRMC